VPKISPVPGPAPEQPRTSAPATSTFAKHSVRFVAFIFHPGIDQLPFSLLAVSIERLTASVFCSLPAENLDTKSAAHRAMKMSLSA
jgi:hypothetical protein